MLANILCKLFPDSVWGSRANRSVFLGRTLVIRMHREQDFYGADVWRFVQLGRFDQLAIHALFHRFQPKACEWLGVKPAQWSANEMQIRARMLQRFFAFVFNDIITPILRVHAFVLEHQCRAVVSTLCRTTFTSLKRGHFETESSFIANMCGTRLRVPA